MQKSIISLSICSLIGMSSLSYAAVAPVSYQVSDPNMNLITKPKFELTVGALYLKPSASNLDYAVLGYPFPTNSPHWNVQSVSPSYSWGFDLGARYYIPSSNYDLAANWDHLNTSDSSFTQVPSGSGLFVVLPFQAGPSFGQELNNPSQQASSTVKFNYDVVNVDIGKNISFDTQAQTRFFIGLSGAQLKQNISTTFADNAHTFSMNSTNNSNLTGLGPLVGVDGDYTFSNGFGVFGGLMVSELIGNLNPSTTYTATSPELGSVTNHQSISPKSSTQGVPGINGKIGVNYSHTMGKEAIFKASLGYEYATYLNAIATYNPSAVFGNVNTGTIALVSLEKTMSNYTVQGLFLNLGFNFA